jgi:Fe2+ or Zn2+ uptake regulation protein
MVNRQRALQAQLDELDGMLAKFDVFEGKAAQQAPTRRNRSGQRGSRREELLRIINQSHGLSRGEILDKMGLKGNKSGEMSVSNALTALTKSKQVTRRDRKYVAS